MQKYGLFRYRPNFWRRNFGEIFRKFPFFCCNGLSFSGLLDGKIFLCFSHFLDSVGKCRGFGGMGQGDGGGFLRFYAEEHVLRGLGGGLRARVTEILGVI